MSNLLIKELSLSGLLLVVSKRFGDQRGFFSETYNRKAFAAAGIDCEFVQDNHSLSAEQGTVRGLHFQTEPFAQAKLVRVVRGSILDVMVDIRKSSPTFGKWDSAVLSAANGEQAFVPVGFAHGFCTLEPDTEVVYKVSNYYAPEHDRGIYWNDPDLGIDWPVSEQAAVLSDKDRKHPALKDCCELG